MKVDDLHIGDSISTLNAAMDRYGNEYDCPVLHTDRER